MRKKKIDRRYLGFAVQVTAPFIALWMVWQYATWPLMILSLAVFFMMRCIGATIMYHRILSHNTHTMHPVVAFICTAFGFYGSLTAPVSFCAAHESHHKYSDTARDPHPPLLIGWRACFPLFWNGDKPTDGLDLRTIARLRRNKIANFFDKYYWYLIALPFLLLFVSPQAYMFGYFVPMAMAMAVIPLTTLNHDSNGPKNMGTLYGIITGGEHMHKWHHEHPYDTTGEGWLNTIICLIATKNTKRR